MKKGFTIIEMITVIGIFAVLMIPLTKMLMIVTREIPFSYRIVSRNTILLNAMEHLEKDVKNAKSFPAEYKDTAADVNNLIIELSDKVVCYSKVNEIFVRKNLDTGDISESMANCKWNLPDAVIEWKLWKRNGGVYALEVQTCFRVKNRGVMETRLANSYVFFVDKYKDSGK